jgi:hypothetical protein
MLRTGIVADKLHAILVTHKEDLMAAQSDQRGEEGPETRPSVQEGWPAVEQPA